MPRSQQNKESAILCYFDDTPLEIAAVILNLVTSKVRARQKEKAVARQRGLEGARKAEALRKQAAKASTPKPAAGGASKGGKATGAGPKKSHHKKKPSAPPPAQIDDYDGDGSDQD